MRASLEWGDAARWRGRQEMTPAAMREALGVGPEWQVIWEGRHALPDVQHLCGGLYGPGGTYVSEYVRLRFEASGMPGIEAALCERRRVAWVGSPSEGTAASSAPSAWASIG